MFEEFCHSIWLAAVDRSVILWVTGILCQGGPGWFIQGFQRSQVCHFMYSNKEIITFTSSSANQRTGKKMKKAHMMKSCQKLSLYWELSLWTDLGEIHAFSSSISLIRVSVVTSKCLTAIRKIPWKHGTLVSSPSSCTKYVLVMQVCS